MGVRAGAPLAAAACACLLLAAFAQAAGLPAARAFREAGERARAGDYPGAAAVYDSLARSGGETAALDWNRAQVASARGAPGEALWALLRARELSPSDGAVSREIERLREAANLDRAELAPDPLAAVARTSRQLHLDLVACLLLLASLAAHAVDRRRATSRRPGGATWALLALGIAVTLVPVAASFARTTGVVVRRGAALLEAASPTADAVGTLREGEVVPILERGGAYVRVEDSSGARGWALATDVRPLGGRR